MRKSIVLVAALLTATSAMAADLSVSKSNCSISYINKVAMNEGLAKATTLSKNSSLRVTMPLKIGSPIKRQVAQARLKTWEKRAGTS